MTTTKENIVQIVGTPRVIVWSQETHTNNHDWQSTCLVCGESSGLCWTLTYLRVWKNDHWTAKHRGDRDIREA